MSESLPSLESPYPVPDDVIAAYRADGHCVLRGVASPTEIAAWRPVIEDVALAHSTESRPLDERDTYSKAFLQIQNLWCVDERIRRFSLAGRFGQIAADLLGVDAVRMYHDQALFKEAAGGRTPYHQDQYYFPLSSDAVVTMWMPLVSVTEEIGSMTFASGSHRLGYLGEFEISDESDAVFEALVAERSLPLTTHGALAPGDATFHAGWTLHCAPPNPTGRMRAVMTVIYFADGLRGIEPEHEWHRKDYAKWLPDVAPGSLAAGRLNPVVWRRPS